MDDYFKLILGSTPAATFFAAYTFALVGIYISLQTHANARDVAGPDTPVTFSYKFLALDNLIRIVGSALSTLLTLFIMIRFSEYYFGTAITMIGAFALGFGYDKAFQVFKNASLNAGVKVGDVPAVAESDSKEVK